MQADQDIKANILIEIENTAMHRFVSKEKSLFTSGIDCLYGRNMQGC